MAGGDPDPPRLVGGNELPQIRVEVLRATNRSDSDVNRAVTSLSSRYASGPRSPL